MTDNVNTLNDELAGRLESALRAMPGVNHGSLDKGEYRRALTDLAITIGDVCRAMRITMSGGVGVLSVADAITQLSATVEAEKRRNAARDQMLATVIVNLEKSEMTAEFAVLLRDYVRAERAKLATLDRLPAEGEPEGWASCPGCNGTGNQGGNPSYGDCDDCGGSGKIGTSAAPSNPVIAGGKFKLGDRVTKTKGSAWTGIVVGYYSTRLTPIGYAVESENEPGSVQIYPEAALSVKLQSSGGQQ